MESFQLTNHQRVIHEKLKGAPILEELFLAAITVRRQEGNPARRFAIGVAIRELIKGLPFHVDPVELPGRDTLEDQYENIKELSHDWVTYFPTPLTLIDGETLSAAQAFDPNYLQRLDRFMRREAAVAVFVRDRLTTWLRQYSSSEETRDAVSQTAATLMSFNGDRLVHVDRWTYTNRDAEAIAEWDRFESALFGIFAPKHRAIRRLDDLLRVLNQNG